MSTGRFITADSDVEEAAEKLGELVEHHRATGSPDPLAAATRAVGLSFWSGWNILKGRRKAIGSGVLAAIREAYWNYVEQQLASYEAKRRTAKRGCGDDFQDLDSAVASVVARLREARKRQR